MINWNEKPQEIAYLFNPSFLASIILYALDGYGECMPFTEVYLICPLILHKETRGRISSSQRSSLYSWAMKNEDVLADFPERASALVVYANEAIEFLLGYKLIEITKEGIMRTSVNKRIQLSKILELDGEISDCMKKAKCIGRWFFKMHTPDNIYSALGVRP